MMATITTIKPLETIVAMKGRHKWMLTRFGLRARTGHAQPVQAYV